MKKIVALFFKTALLLLAFPAICFSQNGLSWSPPLAVAPASFGNGSPRITLLPDGSPAVVWGKSSQIWFSKWTNGAFTAPVQIGTGSVAPGIYEFGGVDVAASSQRVFVVFEQFQQGIFCARSDDGGATWLPPVTVFTPPTGRGTTISSIAVDAAGNPLISFLYQTASETNANVQLVRSLDGGLTFSVSADASAPADDDFACECCYQDILPTGGDTVFVAFRANRANIRDMWVTRSTDGGSIFETACDADAQDWTVNVCPFSGPRLAWLSGDSLLSVWMSKSASGLRVFGSTLHTGSMAKGWEFGFPVSSSSLLFNQNHPDVSGNRDTVAVVWEETGFTGTAQDIVCAFSTTGTAGLPSNRFNVSAAIGTQKFPQLTYRDGVVHLLYTDPTQGLIYRRGQVVAPSSTTEAVAPQLRLFPNPADDFVQLETFGTAARAVIFTATGQFVREVVPTNGQFSVAGLQPGVYFLKIYGQNSQLLGIGRVVKK